MIQNKDNQNYQKSGDGESETPEDTPEGNSNLSIHSGRTSGTHGQKLKFNCTCPVGECVCKNRPKGSDIARCANPKGCGYYYVTEEGLEQDCEEGQLCPSCVSGDRKSVPRQGSGTGSGNVKLKFNCTCPVGECVCKNKEIGVLEMAKRIKDEDGEIWKEHVKGECEFPK